MNTTKINIASLLKDLLFAATLIIGVFTMMAVLFVTQASLTTCALTIVEFCIAAVLINNRL